MKMFQKAPDGGVNSGTTAYFLIEIKPLFSIALLRFSRHNPERYHTHAFNAYTIWLKGQVREHIRGGQPRLFKAGQTKITKREHFHKVEALGGPAWAISFRGPWVNRWHEDRAGNLVTLTHGRKEVL
jgi:hypothetical protein